MTLRQDTVSSLILAPIRSGLRGFCLFIFEIFSLEYQQKNPLKYYVLPFLCEFVNNVHFRFDGFTEAKTMSALCRLSQWLDHNFINIIKSWKKDRREKELFSVEYYICPKIVSPAFTLSPALTFIFISFGR